MTEWLRPGSQLWNYAPINVKPGGGGGGRKRGRYGAFDISQHFFKFPTLGGEDFGQNRSNIPTQNFCSIFCKFSCYLQYIYARFPILQNI